MNSKNLMKLEPYLTNRRSLAGVAAVSIALTGVAHANVVGSSFQNFNPTSGNKNYVTVESSRTLGYGEYSLGLFLNHSTNTAPYSKGTEGARNQSRTKMNDGLLASDLAIGVGLLDRLDVGIVVPMVLNQSLSSDDEHGQFAEKGVTEYRISTKLKLYSNDGFGLALVGSANINQTNNNPYAGLGGGPAYNVQLISDIEMGRLNIAGNLGYRIANEGPGDSESPIRPFGNQVIASLAADYALTDKVHGIGEIYGGQSSRNETDFSGRSSSNSELIAGIKYFYSPDFAMHFGGGTELQHGTSTPDWRVYTGLTWTNGINRNKPAAKATVAAAPSPAVMGPPKPAQVPETVVIVSDVLFGFNSSRLVQKGTFKNLENLIRLVTQKPDLEHLTIEGHTCSIGNDKYNRDLSRKRAESIKELLVTKYNIDARKIQALGYGESRPLASNATREGRAKNRRVEFKIYRKQAPAAGDQLITKK